jgi:hypothetical protein
MFNSNYTDLNPNTNIQSSQNQLLKTIKSHGINDYKDKNSFNIGILNPSQYSHTSSASSQHYIQALENIDEKYQKIFLFGKYQTATATNNIDIVYSNELSSGSSSPYSPPTTLIFGESIRGKLKSDGFYHFTHTINAVPRYVSFHNPSSQDLTGLIIHYVKTT